MKSLQEFTKEFNKKFDNLLGKRLSNINFKKRKYFFKIRKNDLNNKVIKKNKQIHQFAERKDLLFKTELLNLKSKLSEKENKIIYNQNEIIRKKYKKNQK